MAMPNVPGDESLTGAVLSRRFVLKHEIGRGGMGAVYAAEPVGGGSLVAIKILHPYFLVDSNVMSRFFEEGRTCMRLVHPNILRVHECLAAEDGSPYLVMDLLEGIPLSAYTRNGGRVALAHAIPILQGMLAGLEAAHASGVVHRDLKPGNVFLARAAGGVFSVKLLDFGIAKVMDAAGGMGTKTSTGALLGTPAYMSPEQVKSAKDVDGRSDLWSVGVMFYEMLTGRVAFPAPTEYARLAAVISAKPTPIESIDPQLAVVKAFMERALEKDRERRFQTASEMAAALGSLGPFQTLSETSNQAHRVALGLDASQQTASPPTQPGRDDPSLWNLVTDADPPPTPAPKSSSAPRDVLVAQLLASPQTTTLASPNRSSSIPRAPSAHPPPDVVIVPPGEAVGGSKREAGAAALPRRRSVALGVALSMVTVALAVGFAVGYVVAAGR